RLRAECLRGHHPGDGGQAHGHGSHGRPEVPADLLPAACRAPGQPRPQGHRAQRDPVRGGVPAAGAQCRGWTMTMTPADGPAQAALVALRDPGVATVYEAAGRVGLIDADLIQVVPGSRAAGPARIAYCHQGDNRAVHAVMAAVRPGDVLVLTMPSPAPVALVGELLATQAAVHGAVAILVDAAVRDLVELRELGLPIWTRWVRVAGATKD